MLNLTLVVAGLKELVVEELGGTIADAALFFTVEMVAYLAFGPLWGFLSDRSGARRPFVVGGFAASGLLYLSYLFVDSIPLLLALRFLQGGASIAGWSTAMAIVFDGSDETTRSRRAGATGAAMILGIGTGAPIGGLLSQAVGPRAPLGVAGALFLLLALAALALRPATRTLLRPTLREIGAALAAAPRLLLPAALYLLERFTVGLFVVIFPVYLQQFVEAGPAARGRYLALFLFPFALGQLLTYRLARRFAPLSILALGLGAYGASFAAVGYLSAPLLVPWMALLGALAAVIFPPTLALTAAWSPPEARASAFAGFNFAGSLGFALGPLFGVWVAGAGGYPAAFAAAGAIAIVGSMATAIARRRFEPSR